MHLADALSSAYLPLKENINNTKQAIFETIYMCSYLPICDKRLRQIHRDGESLQLLRHVILTSWPDSYAIHTLFSLQR